MRQLIINFIVYCDGIIVFLKFVEASNVIKDYKYMCGLLVDVIKEVDNETVVQIVIDTRSNFKKFGGSLWKNIIYFGPHVQSIT